MTVEYKRGCMTGEDGAIDKFPLGMRVLAVDDDPICLKVLENLLRKCQYQVTITNQAVTALKMLRENRDKYDLVISDVNMPDMDGFKLLELVGLEMDLPVIMLSAHSDTKLVMKGITHGACDYLLKPVRIEELKNIWQHVIRRKKIDPKEQNKSHKQENALVEAGESGRGATSAGKSDQNGKSNRKRKEQDENEDEGCDSDGHENEESTTQKKPRVVWSVELHKKFVGAVNQLGLDKAVPKKILDLMNVDGLTRENVASHLQKYRLYLRRISNVASHQAGMVAALGSKDSSYIRMGSLDGFGDLRLLSNAGLISRRALSSCSRGSTLGRLNSTAGLTIRGIASSGIIQPSHSQTLTNSFNTLGKIQQAMLGTNSSAKIFQEINQLQQSKSASYIGGNFNHINDPTAFTAASTTIGSSSSCVSNASCNPLMFQANAQQAHSRGTFRNQSSLNVASLNPESLDMGVCGSSNFLDHSRCDESWQGAVQLAKFPSNSLPLSESFSHDHHIASNPLNVSSSMATSTPLEDSRGDVSFQAGLIGNIVQNYTSNQQWEEHRQDYNTRNLNNSFSTVNSLVSGSCTMGPFGQSMDQNTASFDTKVKSNDDYLLDECKSPDGFIRNNYDSLDDIMNSVIKRDPAESLLMDGELGFDAYSLGSCM